MILEYLGEPSVITRVLTSEKGRCDYGRENQRDGNVKGPQVDLKMKEDKSQKYSWLLEAEKSKEADSLPEPPGRTQSH